MSLKRKTRAGTSVIATPAFVSSLHLESSNDSKNVGESTTTLEEELLNLFLLFLQLLKFPNPLRRGGPII